MDVCNPVSEFIAREHEALGGLENEFGFNQPSSEVAGLIGIEQPNNAGFVLLNGDEKPSPPVSPQLAPTAPKDTNSGLFSQPHAEINGFFFANHSTAATESWREEFNKRLALKDAEEEKAKTELEEKAKTELDDWYVQYRKERESHSKTVRNLQETAENGTPNAEKSKPTVNDATAWTTVCNMCDFQAKQKDTGRMRDIIVSLKSPTQCATDVI